LNDPKNSIAEMTSYSLYVL